MHEKVYPGKVDSLLYTSNSLVLLVLMPRLFLGCKRLSSVLNEPSWYLSNTDVTLLLLGSHRGIPWRQRASGGACVTRYTCLH